MPFWTFSKKKIDAEPAPKANDIETEVVTNEDGSASVTTSFTLAGPPREVRSDVVDALDSELAALSPKGVMHAIDPTRNLAYQGGGPPIWSVGIVEVDGPVPYTLLVSYGFSHVLAPEAVREPYSHEYSIAVPAGTPARPWADALLRHLSRHVLDTGAELREGDMIPFFMPLTRIPFAPDHREGILDTSLVGAFVTRDPVVPTVRTPHGEIEVRRLVGIDQSEVDRVDTWSRSEFIEAYAARDPLLLTDLNRPSAMDDPEFRAAVDARAASEGSEVEAFRIDASWTIGEDAVYVRLPAGREGRKLLEGLRRRVPFGEELTILCPSSPPITFTHGEFDLQIASSHLVIGGDLDDPTMLEILGRLSEAQTPTVAFRFALDEFGPTSDR